MQDRRQVTAARLSALLKRIEARTRRLDGLGRRYGWVRLGLVVAGAGTAFLAFQGLSQGWGWAVLVLFMGVFIAVGHLLRRVERSIRRHKIWSRIKAAHLARLTLDWALLPPPVPATADPHHPFGADLNLVGPRSLHHLLDTATSYGGSQRLRDWLLEPVPDVDSIRQRQALVRELAALPAFRDRLTLQGALLAEDPEEPWDGEALQRWLDEHTPRRSLRPLLVGLGALAVLNAVLFGLYLFFPIPALWSVTFVAYAGLYTFKYFDLRYLFDQAFELEKRLKRFQAIASYLETYPYRDHVHLAALCAPFLDAGRRPSILLKKVRRIALAANSQKSELLMVVLNGLMPWDLYFAYRLDWFKTELRTELPRWLDTWYHLEAACSLATFAGLHADYTFPKLLPSSAPPETPLFQARQLGHPLLPHEQRVCNDFSVLELGSVALVTGSNMSGKSTFLRTLGMTLRLAYVGGPVPARACSLQPFRLFTCLNVIDSVNDGISYFYAEVRRLKALLDALHQDHPLPLFFLIDEIFRGTNNRERLIGGRAYVRALVGRHGAGLISTHDLELVSLAAQLDSVRNYHFREEVHGGRMTFDYRIRRGPCPTTNALKIMELSGLPVDTIPEPGSTPSSPSS